MQYSPSLRSHAFLAGFGALALLVGCGAADEAEEEGALENSPVVVNEVGSKDGDPVELFNRSGAPVDLAGWYVHDASMSADKKYVIPYGTVIPPGGYLVLKKKEDHSFGFGKDDAVYLFDRSGRLTDQADWDEDEAVISFCRIPNGTGPHQRCSTRSLGKANPSQAFFAGSVVQPAFIVYGPDGDVINNPDELGYDAKGRLWVGDAGNYRMVVFDTDGTYLRTVGGKGSGPGDFADDGGSGGPHAIRASADNTVYATDRAGLRVNVYDGDTFEALDPITYKEFRDPKGLAIASDGTIYVSDQSTDEVYVFDSKGKYKDTWKRQSQTVTDYEGAVCYIPCAAETLAIDEKNDRLFVTSANAGRIEVYNLSSGEYENEHVVEPQTGTEPEPGRVFDEVEGVAIDEDRGWLLAVDEHNGRILVHDLTSSGLTDPQADFAFLGAFGEYGSGPGELNGTDGIAIDPSGTYLAVADQENDRVQVFRLSDIAAQLGL